MMNDMKDKVFFISLNSASP